MVFVISCLYFGSFAATGLNLYDEAIRLYGAQRVLAGDLPYHDFYAIYGPAQFYSLAGLFAVFGEQVLVLRGMGVVVNALTAAILFCWLDRAGVNLRLRLIVVGLFLLPRQGYGEQLMILDPSVMLALAAGCLLTVGHDDAGRRKVFAAGALLGLAMLFRHDIGVYAFAAATMTIRLSQAGDGPLFISRKAALGRFGWLAAGATLTGAVPYAALLVPGVDPVVDCLFRYPMQQMPFRRLPFPWADLVSHLSERPWAPVVWLEAIVFLTPILVAGVGAIAILVGKVSFADRPTARATLVYGSVFSLGVSFYSFGRCDFVHMFPLYAVTLVVGAILFDSLIGRSGIARPVSFCQGLVAAVAGVLALLMMLQSLLLFRVTQTVPLERAMGIRVQPTARWVVHAVNDPHQLARQGPLFVGSDRHDRVIANAILFYFLTGRPSATYFHHFDPGITTTEAVQRQIVDDLERRRVDEVILVGIPVGDEPNQSRHSSGVFVLDQYLHSTFETAFQTVEYAILRRRQR